MLTSPLPAACRSATRYGRRRGRELGARSTPNSPSARRRHRCRQHTETGETDMGTIVISTNVTLDGVVQDPDGAEGFRGGGWFGRFGGADLEEWGKVSFDEALGATALLLGRTSDEWFAER